MPDYSMCAIETCSVKGRCLRNPASGTVPSAQQQPWLEFGKRHTTGPACPYFVAVDHLAAKAVVTPTEQHLEAKVVVQPSVNHHHAPEPQAPATPVIPIIPIPR